MSKAGRERYLQQVIAIVDAFVTVLTPAELAEVRHLIDHGEPAEGLRTLAWIIHDEGKPATLTQKRELLALSSGLIDEADMPGTFRKLGA